MLHSICSEPAVIVIFGGSSDLTKRERLPSLYDLYQGRS